MVSEFKAVLMILGVFCLMVLLFLARQNAYLAYVDKLPVCGCENTPDATKQFVQGFTSQTPACRPSTDLATSQLWPLR